MTYSSHSVPWHGESEVVRSKMSIVREQIRLVRSIYPQSHIVFVFIDDIYAVGLADAIRRNGNSLIPPNTTLHLIQYESFDERTTVPSTGPERVKENVLLWLST